MYATIKKEGRENRIITAAIDYKGYFCREIYVGVGKYREEVWSNGIDDAGECRIYEKYIPRNICFFNSFLLAKDGLSQIDLEKRLKDLFGCTTISKADVKDIIGSPLEKYLVKIGENEGGLFIELNDPEMERRKENEMRMQGVETGEICINFTPGIFGLRCETEMPKHIWGLIKKYATYHKGDDEDEEWADEMGHYECLKENLCGWFYDAKALEILKKNSLRVSYCGIEMKTMSFGDVLEELEARKSKVNRLKEFYQDIRKMMKYMPVEDVVSTGLEKNFEYFFALPGIGINGHNIYGSGTLLFIDDSFLYIIDNNGMDGDDWSRNNLGTGGAGAIAYRTPLTEEVKNWLNDSKTLRFV